MPGEAYAAPEPPKALDVERAPSPRGASPAAGFPVALEHCIPATVGLCVATFATSYTVSAFKDTLSHYYLSSSINHPPASCWGSLGLSLVAFVGVGCGLARYYAVRVVLGSAEASGAAWAANEQSRRLGVVALLALVGVGAFEFSSSALMHNTCAAAFFILSLRVAWLQVRVDSLLAALGRPLTEPHRVRRRWWAVRLGVATAAVMLPLSAVGHHLAAAALEIAATVLLLVFVWSFREELTVMGVELRVSPVVVS